MKKLWSAVDTAVSAGAAELKSRVYGPGGGPPGDASTGGPPAAPWPRPAGSKSGGSHADASEKQYLRLPIESARKLRWYDKGDLNALVRVHLREKRELEDGLAALKRLLLRKGVTEAEMDAEALALMGAASSIQESDEGVASVLLTACMAEVEALQAQNTELNHRVSNLTQRLQRYEGVGTGAFGMYSLGGDEDTSPMATASHAVQAPGPALPPHLLDHLTEAMQQCEEAMAAAAAASRRLRGTEQDVATAELEAALLVAAGGVRDCNRVGNGPQGLETEASGAGQGGGTAGDGWDVDNGDWDRMSPVMDGHAGDTESDAAGGGAAGLGANDCMLSSSSGQRQQTPVGGVGWAAPPPAALLAKVQRLERERRDAEEQVAEMAAELAVAREAADRAGALAASAAQAMEQASNLGSALEAARADLAAARATARAAEELAERRGADLRRLQVAAQGVEQLRRLQDALADAQERATEAERRTAVLEARCSEKEAALKEKAKQLQQLQAENAKLSSQASAAALPPSGIGPPALRAVRQHARSASASISPGASPLPDDAATPEQLAAAQEAAAAAQRDLAMARATMATSDARLTAAEGKEARLMAELREAEAGLAERDELAAQVAVLREALEEGRAGRAQADHYRQMAAELSQGQAALEEQLLVTGQLVTQLDGRLREATARADAAEAAVQAAEARARAAAASVAGEVEARLSAAAANKALWPAPAREELGRLEARIDTLTTSLASCKAQLADQTARTAGVQQALEAAGVRYAALERRNADAVSQAAERVEQLTAALQAAQQDAAAAAAAQRRAEREVSMLRATAAPGGPPRSPAVRLEPSSPASVKWQVQNTVGGGSLYGVADAVQAHALADGGGWDGKTTPPHIGGATSTAAQEVLGTWASTEAPSRQPSSGGPFSAAYNAERLERAESVRGVTGGSASHGSGRTPPRIASAGRLPGDGGGGGRVLEGVDILYLKNVVLKFLEAALAGRGPERDALLPAVATLLQATPAEFQVLKKVVHATAPPATQVLSALGLKLA